MLNALTLTGHSDLNGSKSTRLLMAAAVVAAAVAPVVAAAAASDAAASEIAAAQAVTDADADDSPLAAESLEGLLC